MAISIHHSTYVITIPKADTTYVTTNATTGYEIRSYDEYALMRQLADYLDSDAGQVLPNAFTHATQVTISGVVFARSISFLSPYTITFENGLYQVKLIGGTNNNMLDVLNPNSVSVIVANSAGLQQVSVSSGSDLDVAQDAKLTAINAAIQEYLDATISSRLASIDYEPPSSGSGATPTQIADAVRTELSPELANMDAKVSKTLTTTKFLGLQ